MKQKGSNCEQICAKNALERNGSTGWKKTNQQMYANCCYS